MAAISNAQPAAFEVSTIKPSQSFEVTLRVDPSALFTAKATSLIDLIKFAYDLHSRQIVAGPAWLESEKYDVTGKSDQPGMPSGPQLKQMVRTLLATRFQLAFHRDQRELSVYTITVAKSGPRLTKNNSDPSGLPTFGAGLGRFSLKNGTMAEFASILQAGILDRPALDQTGLGSARYDLKLAWTPDGAAQSGAEPHNPDAPPDLFTAFQQQLGLKLESVKAPVDVLVIDRAEKPSAN